MRLGIDEQGQDVHVPMSQLLPMIHPDDLGKFKAKLDNVNYFHHQHDLQPSKAHGTFILGQLLVNTQPWYAI